MHWLADDDMINCDLYLEFEIKLLEIPLFMFRHQSVCSNRKQMRKLWQQYYY